MGFLSKLVGLERNNEVPSGRGTKDADTAIRDARAGLISVQAMLGRLLDAQVYVPVADPPTKDGDFIEKWKPCTLTKENGGAQFLVAFTERSLVTSFVGKVPNYPYCLQVDAKWVLSAMPPAHGILFNYGGENGFEWTAEGITDYKVVHPT